MAALAMGRLLDRFVVAPGDTGIKRPLGRLHLVALVAVVLVTAVVVVAQLAPAANNLVVNPGFESGLSGWSCSGGSTVGSPVHGGAAALTGAVSSNDTAQCTQNVAVVS